MWTLTCPDQWSLDRDKRIATPNCAKVLILELSLCNRILSRQDLRTLLFTIALKHAFISFDLCWYGDSEIRVVFRDVATLLRACPIPPPDCLTPYILVLKVSALAVLQPYTGVRLELPFANHLRQSIEVWWGNLT